MMIKKALICDWLNVYAGAERCVESFTNIWADFEIYSLIDFLNDTDRYGILKNKYAHTSFIQNLPFAKSRYRDYLPLFPYAIENFNLSVYDLILSSSHAVAMWVLTHSDQLHISYVHTPIRYAWDLYFEYLKNSGLNSGLKGFFAKYFLHKIRIWDLISTNRVDYFIANSRYIASRIKKIYGRASDVIYPPVDTDKFEAKENKDEFYLTVSRLVPYKKVDVIVEAFSQINRKLVLIGDGPDMDKIKSKAKKNIEILGYQSNETIKHMMQNAKAFIFAAKEDFGIAPVEAQACGTPVICYGNGGVRETVIDNVSGVYFYEQSVESLLGALDKFEHNVDKFDSSFIRRNSLRFSRKRFEEEIKTYIEHKFNEFKALK